MHRKWDQPSLPIGTYWYRVDMVIFVPMNKIIPFVPIEGYGPKVGDN